MELTWTTDMITRHEAAALAGVDVRTIKRWHVAGKLTGYRNTLNGHIRYSRKQLLEKIEDGQQDG